MSICLLSEQFLSGASIIRLTCKNVEHVSLFVSPDIDFLPPMTGNGLPDPVSLPPLGTSGGRQWQWYADQPHTTVTKDGGNTHYALP